MKSFLFLLILLGWCSVSFADDVAEAKAAFATFQTYEKTDDIRALDLFSTNCVVIFTIVNGGQKSIKAIPPMVFREELKRLIAQKQGNNEVYENLKFTGNGFSVKATATIYQSDTGERAPLSILYERDHDGVLRIFEFKATQFVNSTNQPAHQP